MDKIYITGMIINRNLSVQSSFHLDFLQLLYDKPTKLSLNDFFFLQMLRKQKLEIIFMTFMVLFLIMKRIQITEFL